MQITITIPKLTTIRAHWRWGLLAAFMLVFTLTSGGSAGAPSAQAANTGAKTEMSLEVTGTFGGPVFCDSKTVSKCTLTTGSSFTVSIIPNTIPTTGYAAWQTLLSYGSLLYKPAASGSAEIKFGPPSVFPARDPALPTGKEGTVGHSDLTAFSPDPGTGLFPASFQKTSLVNLQFNCARNAGGDFSQLISLIDFNASPSGAVYAEPDSTTNHIPNVTPLTINCVEKTAMSLEVTGTFGGPVFCDSKTQSKCTLAVGSTFTVSIIPNTIPGGGYGGWQTLVDYGDLTYKPAGGENKWNLSFLAGRSPFAPTGKEGQISHADASNFSPPLPLSNQTTSIVNLTMNCTDNSLPAGANFSTVLSMISLAVEPDGTTYFDAGLVAIIPNLSSLDINCQTPPPSEININPKQKDPGPPPFGCYNVLDDSKVFLFTVCDNNAQVGFPQTQPFLGLCDEDGTVVCEDRDPIKGQIRVSVIGDNYNVVESKPPPNYDPTNSTQQSCNVKVAPKCELFFFNLAVTVPWFPQDLDGNGQVALGDFLRLLQVFGQTKP